MNFGQVTTRMALNCDNLQSAHPQFTYIGQMANDGLRFMILRTSNRFPNFQCFPEHKDVEWDDITVADQNYLELPADHIAIQRVFSADQSTAPNYSNASLRPLGWMETSDFDQLPKPTTPGSYPTSWTQRESRLLLWATPRTGYTTYVNIQGIEDEPDMSSSTQTPRTQTRWHPAWLDCATYLLADACGYDSIAARFLASADQKIENLGTSIIGLSRAKIKRAVRIAGMPRGW